MSLRLPGRAGALQDASKNQELTLPATVDGGLGRVPAARIDTTKQVPEPRRMSAQQAQQLMQAELLAAVRSLVESSTELTAKIGRRGATNGVLEVGLYTMPAIGYLHRDYPVTVGSVGIVNHGATQATVHSGQPGDTAPSGGAGVQLIEPGSFLVVPIADRSFTIWAAAGGKISLQAFTGLQPWGAGEVV